MSTCEVIGPRSIADLPDFSEVVPKFAIAGFSEDFSELFARTNVRLLRSTLRSTAGVVVFRNKDLLEIAANPGVGMLVEWRHFQRFSRNLVFSTNPPIHGPMRQVISRPLSPKHIPLLNQVAKRVATELIDEVVGPGEIDFCSQFSDRFTTRFWGALFQMTDSEVERLIDAVREIAPAFLLERTPEDIAAISIAMNRYLELVADPIHRALDQGGNELLESMAAAFNAVHGEAKPDRLGEMIAANVFDGLHTASAAGANALYQLLLSRDHLIAVRADPGLVSNAVTEGLRLWAPLIFTERCALRDLEFAGTMIPKGTVITMLWGGLATATQKLSSIPTAMISPEPNKELRHLAGAYTSVRVAT